MKKLGQGVAVLAAMLMAATPAVAASAQSSASKLSVANSGRVGAKAKDGKSELFGASAIVTALIVGAVIVGVILIADDGNSDSP